MSNAAVKNNLAQLSEEDSLTPPEIVSRLNDYIVSQDNAKKAVAIALRNRWRRLHVPEELQEEITPKNIIMIGPTGVGKTEISRRLANLVRAPFAKVEASKFTEVGYVGRDVESIIRDLVEASFNLVKEEQREAVKEEAEKVAEEELLDLLLPGSESEEAQASKSDVILQDDVGVGHVEEAPVNRTREKLRKLLRQGKLDHRTVEVEVTKQPHTQMQILGPQGFGEIEGQIKDMFSSMVPKQIDTRRVTVPEARKLLIEEAQENLIDPEKAAEHALTKASQSGIVFIDEIDKICGAAAGKTPDVSREGVQRDLLPLVEGCTVNTRYGNIKTDHILFIASGAFHNSKPSDLMPEFQGRFPIRVELKSLTPEHFKRILTEPKNALTKQYSELMKTEGITLSFKDDAIEELALLTAEVNSRTENIGARRLHTLLEKLLEDLSFNAAERNGETVTVDRAYVREKLKDIVADSDLSRFIL